MHKQTQNRGSSDAAQGVQHHNSSAEDGGGAAFPFTFNREGSLLAHGTGVTAGTSHTSDSRFLFCTLQAGLWESERRRRHSIRQQERGVTPAGEGRTILLQPATGYVTAPTTSQGESTLGQ